MGKSAETGQALSAQADTGCFHCGLPIEAGRQSLFGQHVPDVPLMTVLGEQRAFCCHGCHAVCETIMDAGLQDYYRHRDQPGTPQNSGWVPATLARSGQSTDAETVSLYSREEVERQFVHTEAGLETACLLLEDIHCSACVWLNERHLRQLDGVRSVTIDSVTHQANVAWDPGSASLSQLLLEIRRIGYRAYPFDAKKHVAQLQARQLKSTERLIFAGVIGMFVMDFSLATYFFGGGSGAPMPLWERGGRWVSLFACIALLLYPGKVFFASALQAVKRRQINMDVPIALGLSAALSGSAYATLSGAGEVYFEAIAMFVFLVLLSRRWEMKGQSYATRFLARLDAYRVKTGRRQGDEGEPEIVPITELEPGDTVLVYPGEAVPVDAVLLGEGAEFDESLLTGEASRVSKRRGEAVFAGSVNGEQAARLRVEKVASVSTLAQLQRLVLQGVAKRPAQWELINRVASYFVVALLLVTAMTAGYWWASGSDSWLSHAISVLIVTCPCALALAIPVAHAVASGKMLENGILPLNMGAVEALARAPTFIFDKTGTLTESELEFEQMSVADPERSAEVEKVARLMTEESEHPLARALRAHLMAQSPDDKKAEGDERIERSNHPGQGLEMRYAGKHYRLGAIDFVCGGGPYSSKLAACWRAWLASGKQVIVLGEQRAENAQDVASGATILAAFAFANPLRRGAKSMLAALERAGVTDVHVLSGDHLQSVERVAEELGVERAAGRQTPKDKLAYLSALRAAGIEGPGQARILAMVGDGVNDAPTLAAADVSISFASATDLAQLHSDFVLLGTNLEQLAWLRLLARRTRRIVRQNLAWAVAYNLLLVPLAVAGQVAPWMAAVGMSLSSLIVVSNALRLKAGDQAASKSLDAQGLGALG